MTPRGPRPAGSDTRADILLAAAREFSAKGYNGVSVRGIARSAGVDPALVHHYFEGKSGLFVEAMQLPADPGPTILSFLEGPREGVGERIARGFFGLWEAPERQERFVAIVRSAVGHEDASRMLREFLAREVFGRIAASSGVPDPQLRAGLAASQMIGLAMLRYVIGYPPVVQAEVEELVRLVGPTIQRYLVEADPS